MRSPSNLSRRLLVAVAAVTVAQILSIAPVAAAEDPGDPPKFIGMAAVDYQADFQSYEAKAGNYPALRQAYWTLEETWPNSSALAGLTWLDDRGLVAMVEITTNNLDALVRGDRDAALGTMTRSVADWVAAGNNRRIIIAPLPEANLVDFPWGADPAGYKAGYARIRNAFRKAGLASDEVRFVFAMHGTSSNGFSMADFYPGDDVVDIVGFSIINRNNPWHNYASAFQRFIDEIKATITRAKPILVTQTASVEETGDRDKWLRDMFRNLGADDQVMGALYFNRAKTEGGKYNDYRVVIDKWVDPVFLAESRNWSGPSELDWIFNGSMDTWVAAREEIYAGLPFFSDVVGSAFEADILWLASEGITHGCNPPANDRFCPDTAVTRGQMAAFLARALDLPVVSGVDSFIDDNESVFAADIERLKAAGITQGCNPPTNNRYCPDTSVTRGQMAAFLARALDLPVVSGVDSFIDDNESVFAADIERLAAAGITQGCNPPTNNRYCPDNRVTRSQMAAFLARALG